MSGTMAYAILSRVLKKDTGKGVLEEVFESALKPTFDVFEDKNITQHLNIGDADRWGYIRITQIELKLIKQSEPEMKDAEKKSLKNIDHDFEIAKKDGYEFVNYIIY